MKIKRERTKNYVTINDIKAGDVFESINERIFMKIAGNGETNVVDLADGEQYFIANDEPIVPLVVTLTILE